MELTFVNIAHLNSETLQTFLKFSYKQASTNPPPDSPGQVQNHSGKHSAQYRSPPGK